MRVTICGMLPRKFHWIWFNTKCKSVLCCGHCYSVAKLCPTPCDPMDCSTSGFPILHHLLEFVQTHIHWVGDTIQPSHPLLSTSLLDLNLSQHQDLFQWVSSLHQIAKVVELQLQHQFSQWILRVDFLRLTALISLLSKRLSRVFSSNTIWLHQFFFMVQLSHPYMTTGKTIALTI